MSHVKPKMSITLPRNFMFHSSDFTEPKTPDNKSAELRTPPPPRHATCRPNRPRPSLDLFMQHDNLFSAVKSEDLPIPSIELPHDSQPSRPDLRQVNSEPLSDMSDSLLPPPSNRVYTAPRTPPAQIHASPVRPDLSSQWDLRTSSPDVNIERPSSACSGISDSSISSEESFVSHPSFGGSCTSPESDVQDPFMPSIRIKRPFPESPIRERQRCQTMRRVRPKTEWTTEMDNHLWNTYQIYLQDPTVTPFKMVPGSLPPLGVSHRVAREAKRTWPKKMSRSSHGQSQSQANVPLRDVHDEAHAVNNDTATPARSGSTTPTAPPEPTRSLWPRSESATRRRLKELCKRKSSIPIHYQRLLSSRSPSPFLEPLSRRPGRPSRLGSSSSMASSFSGATRDLEVALVSSSATGPLAQLTTGDSPALADDWFNQPVQPNESVGNSTSEFGLGINANESKNIPRLGSPFIPKSWGHKTWGPSHSRQHARLKTPVNHETIHCTGSRLRSPARFDNKRRARHQLEDELSPGGTDLQGQSNFKELWTKGSKDNGQRRVRIRNRGVTTGAVGGSDRLNRLFNPPTPERPSASSLMQVSNSYLQAPAVQTPKRLGSPFELDGDKSGKRPVLSRHAPSLSDPFVGDCFSSNMMNLPSINQNLEAVSNRHSEYTRPYDELEPGLSDAERMNRQLKNYFASRS